jgi:hypothetical protein
MGNNYGRDYPGNNFGRGGGTSDVASFEDLSDGFALTGHGGDAVVVNAGGTALEPADSASLVAGTDNVSIVPNGSNIEVWVNEVYYGNTKPSRNGLIGWNMPPFAGITAANLASGIIYLFKMYAETTDPVSRLWHFVDVAEVGATSGQNWMGLYDSTGARQALSADQTTAFGTTGVKQVDMTASWTPGKGNSFYVALLTNAATTQQGVRRAALNSLGNLGLGSSGANLLYGAYGSGQTTLPSSITLASITATGATPIPIGFS